MPVQFRGKQLKFYKVTSKGEGVAPHPHQVGISGAMEFVFYLKLIVCQLE